MLCLLLFIALLLWTVYIRYQNRHKRKLASCFKKHGMSRLPFIGLAHHFCGDHEHIMKSIIRIGEEIVRQDGIACDWLLNTIVIGIANPHDSEVITRAALNKMPFVNVLKEIVGNGHLIAKVPMWRPRRKVMTSIFTQKNLDNFVNIFSAQAKVLTENLQTCAGKGPFSIWKYITAYSMDAICETTLGTKVNAQNNQKHPFLMAFDEGVKMVATRSMQPWLHSDFIFKLMPWYRHYKKQVETVQEFVRQLVVSMRLKIKQKEENAVSDELENESKSFLELLIEASGGSNGYTDVELQEEMLVLAMAGTDTSAVGISFTIMLLSQYADVQEKVYQELLNVFGDSDRPVLPKDLVQLKYLEAVIKESMRLYPPVPAISRIVENDLNIPSGVKLVKGTGVIIHIWSLHRNKKYWGDDAEEFRPERFYNTTLKYPSAYVAFSDGPRNCIGRKYAMMSMLTVLATMLRRYKLLPSRNIPLYDPQNPKKRLPLRTKFYIMTKHVDNFEVEIERRQP